MYTQECTGRKGMIAGSIYLSLAHGMPWRYLNKDEVQFLDMFYHDAWRVKFSVDSDFKGHDLKKV